MFFSGFALGKYSVNLEQKLYFNVSLKIVQNCTYWNYGYAFRFFVCVYLYHPLCLIERFFPPDVLCLVPSQVVLQLRNNMTQEVSSNPNTNIVQYHVVELNQETWTVNDYNFVSIILKL